MKNIAVFAIALVIGLSAPSHAAAADVTTGVPIVTRLVKLYLEREAAFATAVRAGDAAAIGQFLTDDFELRTGARAARPIPRADFVATLVRTRDPGGEVASMAVHDLGNAAIVSFTQGSRSGVTFVVDVWRQQGSDWKLAIRYASPAGSETYPIPGAGPGEPEIPKKY